MHQLDALSFDASCLSVVAIVRLSVDSEFRREHLARLLKDRQGCRAVSHGGAVVALFQITAHAEKGGVLKRVHSICKSQRCRAALSDVQMTASRLFVHRNTLTYRVKRILELCPVDLDDFNTRHRLLESILIVENCEGITANL